MNFIKLYLQKTNKYKKIILIANKLIDFKKINNLIDSIYVNRFYLYIENYRNSNVEMLNKNIKIISKNELIKFITTDTLIILYKVENNYTEYFKNKIDLLIYTDTYLGNFNNWELYRNCSKHLLCANKINNKVEVLETNSFSDIELSIIIPFYNVEKYIENCVSSLLKWDADYIELIFIDDGSTDGSKETILKYMKKDKRIKYIYKNNGGCASARQKGLENAKGRYVGFVDPDDFIDSEMFKKLFSKAVNGLYDISYCGYNEFYETSKTFSKVKDLIGYPYLLGTTNKKEINYLVSFLKIGIWRAIYSKDMLLKNNINFFTNLKYFDDLPFKIQTLLVANSVVSLNEHLYFYRLERPGQDISKKNEEMFIHFDIFKQLDKYIDALNLDSEALTNYKIAKINTYFWALSKIDNKILKSDFAKRVCEDMSFNEIKTINKAFNLKKSIKAFNSFLKD